MVELKVIIFESSGVFHAQTDMSIDPDDIIKGEGETPYKALSQWLENLQEQDFFRPD